MADPTIDFSMLARLPDLYQRGLENYRQGIVREAFSGGLPRGPKGEIDYARAADIAARAGALDTITPFATLQQGQQRLAESAQHARATESIARGQLELAREQAREKPTYQKWTDPDTGDEHLVRLTPGVGGTPKVEVVRPEGIPAGVANPYGPKGVKLTEGEAKDRG